MKKYLLMALLASAVLWMSCGDKDPEPTEEDFLRNSWIVDAFKLENLPADYQDFEDFEFTSFYGETAYLVTFENEGYTRGLTLLFTNGSGDTTLTEEGEWSLADGELVLDPTGQGLGIGNIFVVDVITENDLILRTESVFPLASDTYRDTVSNAFLSFVDSLEVLEDQTKYDSVLNIILQPVTADVVYDFDLEAK